MSQPELQENRKGKFLGLLLWPLGCILDADSYETVSDIHMCPNPGRAPGNKCAIGIIF